MIPMAACPSPITADNFQTAWKAIARKRRWSIKKELIRRISVTVAQIIYFFIFLFLALGVFYEMTGELSRYFMDQVPEWGIYWNKACEFFFAGTTGEFGRILRCVLALYLVPFGVILPFVVLIVLFYHPGTPKRTGDLKQDAWQLRSLAKHAQVYADKKENMTGNICAVFMGVIVAVFVIGMALFAWTYPALRDELTAEAYKLNWVSFLYGAAMFFLYRIINIPLKLMLVPLHYCRVPASMVEDTEKFHAQVSAGEIDMTFAKGDA